MSLGYISFGCTTMASYQGHSYFLNALQVTCLYFYYKVPNNTTSNNRTYRIVILGESKMKNRKRIADQLLEEALEAKGAVLIEGPKWFAENNNYCFKHPCTNKFPLVLFSYKNTAVQHYPFNVL